jgi:hypothetical protein
LEDYEEEAQQLIHLSAETNTKIDSHNKRYFDICIEAKALVEFLMDLTVM